MKYAVKIVVLATLTLFVAGCSDSPEEELAKKAKEARVSTFENFSKTVDECSAKPAPEGWQRAPFGIREIGELVGVKEPLEFSYDGWQRWKTGWAEDCVVYSYKVYYKFGSCELKFLALSEKHRHILGYHKTMRFSGALTPEVCQREITTNPGKILIR